MLLAVLLLPLVAAGAATRPAEAPDPVSSSRSLDSRNPQLPLELQQLDDTYNDTILDSSNDTDSVIRKKRTFGDIVFRGFADVLGYSVSKKPPPAIPPPLGPVAGIDFPLQAGAAPASPCGSPRANPLPCGQLPPATPPPCPKPRALPPRPNPAPPPPPPCGSPRANPAAPPPCGASPQIVADALPEKITSNLRLSFNFNRVTTAPPAPAQPPPQPAVADPADYEQQEQIPIEPKAARLPQDEPERKPRVYVDAFVVRNGVAQKVDAVDAERFNPRRPPADDDYLAYDDDDGGGKTNQAYDDYEDAQESRDRAKAVQEFGTAVGRFWKHKQPKSKKSGNRYADFGDRNSRNKNERHGSTTHQSLQREQPRYKNPTRIPQEDTEPDDGSEATTTTEDPHSSLKPRILPKTEQNPGQIDTITVRVPPIYKEKRPRKQKKRPDRTDRPDRDEENEPAYGHGTRETYYEYDSDSPLQQSSANQEPPPKRRRRKHRRKTRSVENSENSSDEYEGPYSAGDYDYRGRKLPVTEEEKTFERLFAFHTADPPPDPDVERVEGRTSKKNENVNKSEQLNYEDGDFLDDHERLSEEESLSDEIDKSSEKQRADDSEKANYKENERSGEQERSDSIERSDALSPNALVHLTGYRKNLVRATNVKVDDPRPNVGSVKKKSVRIGTL